MATDTTWNRITALLPPEIKTHVTGYGLTDEAIRRRIPQIAAHLDLTVEAVTTARNRAVAVGLFGK